MFIGGEWRYECAVWSKYGELFLSNWEKLKNAYYWWIRLYLEYINLFGF